MFASQYPPRRRLSVTTDQYHHKETIWRILLDIVSLVILLIVALIVNYVGTPFTSGFFCSDTSIKYPYKNNTIPTYAAVILSLVLPLIWMLITEICKRYYFSLNRKQTFVTRLELCGSRIVSVSPFIRNLYILTVIFLYGYLATWILTGIAKNFVGELRPHFLAVCQPSYNCSTVTSLNQFNTYLQQGTDYTCQNTDTSSVQEARRSFFSGHSSSIFYGFGWLIMYIHVAWSWRYLGILGHLFQVGLAILGTYIAYTRITDYQHHWDDVLVGAIVGALIAFAAFKFILNWQKSNHRFLPYTVESQPSVPLIYQGPYGNYRNMSPNIAYRRPPRY